MTLLETARGGRKTSLTLHLPGLSVFVATRLDRNASQSISVSASVSEGFERQTSQLDLPLIPANTPESFQTIGLYGEVPVKVSPWLVPAS